MDLKTFTAELEKLENDETLALDASLPARARALEWAALVDEFAHWNRRNPAARALQQRAGALRQRLTALNAQLFQRLREQIRAGNYTPPGLRRQFDQYTDYRPGQAGTRHLSSDGLDVLVNGLLKVEACSTTTQSPGPDMIHYQPTPARVVLDLLDHAGLQPDDVVYDLGSGLGQVVILVNLLSGVRAKGVEIEPALCRCAQDCAQQLGSLNVDFINADARAVDYADGTVFYMFRPFKGAVLQAVLEKLRREAQKRPLKLCTYGAGTPDVARLPWMKSLDANAGDEFRLALFQTL